MKWTGPTREQRKARQDSFTPWFAWYPVEVENGTHVWLEWIERRIEYKGYRIYTYYRWPRHDLGSGAGD